MAKFLSIRHKTLINKSIKRSQQNPGSLSQLVGHNDDLPSRQKAFRANMSKFCSPSTVNRDVPKWVRNFRTGRKIISQSISEWILSFLSASSLSNTAVSSNLKKNCMHSQSESSDDNHFKLAIEFWQLHWSSLQQQGFQGRRKCTTRHDDHDSNEITTIYVEINRLRSKSFIKRRTGNICFNPIVPKSRCSSNASRASGEEFKR